MLGVLRDHREHVLWWDQYALNVVLAGRWKEIDPRWNQNAHIHVYPSWQHSPLSRETFVQLRDDPWIVHFCSPAKPWHYFCEHPSTRDFCKYLKQTAWRDWKPAVPEDYLRKWWKFHVTPIRRQLKSYEKQVREVFKPFAAKEGGIAFKNVLSSNLYHRLHLPASRKFAAGAGFHRRAAGSGWSVRGCRG